MHGTIPCIINKNYGMLAITLWRIQVDENGYAHIILREEKEEEESTMKYAKYRHQCPALSCFTKHVIIELEMKNERK